MWHELREQVQTELEQLNLLLRTHTPLLHKVAHTSPDTTELAALAALLHSFYTGIENIFKRISIELDDGPPSGEFWHRQLLDAMAEATEGRVCVLSATLRDRLKEYLQFRHFFRHAYSFQLQWEKMHSLAMGCAETLTRVETELDHFLRTGPADPGR